MGGTAVEERSLSGREVAEAEWSHSGAGEGTEGTGQSGAEGEKLSRETILIGPCGRTTDLDSV